MLTCCFLLSHQKGADSAEPVRVFIFAGQSNMVGSDSKVADIQRFPPYRGLEKPQTDVKFSYCIGRENRTKSSGWVELQAVKQVVGPELSFARKVTRHIDAPIAIIKCAAGGTHLGGDWNPDEPQGFQMYPLALELIRSSLAELDRKKIPYRLEGFMWHQGENDMFNEGYMASYGKNLKRFLACWRRDLNAPKLNFYIGELCTKTIWGMDLRPRMYAISLGQKSVTSQDELAEYIPTSHIGVEIGGGVGLHYHYGTLGQLEHGENYADAYLRTIGKNLESPRLLTRWPYSRGSRLRLFVFAGHRNMEGERAFIQDLNPEDPLRKNVERIAFRYSLGGGYRQSRSWEPLGPAGSYDTFGPEVSFGHRLLSRGQSNFAIAKFTHSGSQMNDWTPEGSRQAPGRHIYPRFLAFVKSSLHQLRDRDHDVELAGIVYHVGENEMSMPPYRRQVPVWLKSMIEQSRRDLDLPDLKWFVSQQPPTDDKRVNSIDVTQEIEKIAAADPNILHLKMFDLPPQEKKLVIDTAGIVEIGQRIADAQVE